MRELARMRRMLDADADDEALPPAPPDTSAPTPRMLNAVSVEGGKHQIHIAVTEYDNLLVIALDGRRLTPRQARLIADELLLAADMVDHAPPRP